MSKNMKIILAAAGGVLLIALVLTALGKPPNLPIPGLQGVLAGEEAVVADSAPVAPNPVDCGTGSTIPGSGTVTDPAAAATPGATDPAAAPGTTDPTAATDPAAAPADATVTGSASAGWSGSSRIVAADGDGGSWSRVSDTLISAADATTVDPAATGTPVDPTTGAVTDPAAPAGAATDPAAAPAVTDPAAAPAATDPAAATTPADPCAGATDPAATPGATTPPAAAGTTPDAATTAPAAATVARTTTDGTNKGNSPEALRVAKDASTVMQQAKITVSVDATLLPATGGAVLPARVKPYRAKVTAAVLVIKLTDTTAQGQWTTAGAKVQKELVQSFLARLRKSYPVASRSISVVDSTGTLLAIGDAPARAALGAVKLF